MDGSGNLYGSTQQGGSSNNGVVFELMPSNGAWAESILHYFGLGNGDGHSPNGVTLDAAGNIYGTAGGGAGGAGIVYQLLAASGWAENLLYSFIWGGGPELPDSAVTLDPSENIYSTTEGGGSGGGTAFELSSGSWGLNTLYNFSGSCGPVLSALIFDQAGNLYGTTNCDGAYQKGSVFKLTPSHGLP